MDNVSLFLRGFIYYQINDFEKSLEDFDQLIKDDGFGKLPALYWKGMIKRDYLNDNVGANSDFELSIKKYNSSKRFSEQFGVYDVNVCEPYFDYNDAINKLKDF